MKRRKPIVWLVLCLLWLFVSTAWASSSANKDSGFVPMEGNGTDVYTGIVVDYMGKLQFQVTERATGNPIPMASVEIYIASLDRYVLVGMTDENGILDLDVAYNMTTGNPNNFTWVNGFLTIQGNFLYLDSNEIQYQVYKANWRPYPSKGTVTLDTKEIPQIVKVMLNKARPSEGSSAGGGGSGGTVKPVDNINPFEMELQPLEPGADIGNATGVIPKTGVEGAMGYWLIGLILFLISAGLLIYLFRKNRKAEADIQSGIYSIHGN